MTVEVAIKDGRGKNGNTLRINGEGEAHVVVHPHPPRDESIVSIPYRSYFTNGAATDMRVDGSSTAVEFSIDADGNDEVFIKTVSIVIADAGAALNEFGNLAALTNGLDFEWQTSDKGTVTIADQLKTNFDFVRLAGGQPTTAVLSNVIGTSEAFLCVIDLAELFAIPYGLRLRKGSTDKLIFRVNDNVSTVDRFDIIGFGSKL
jgi:hypothetical protein